MARQQRVLIADDHALVREGIKALLSSAPQLEIVGEAGDGNEAIRLANALDADIVFMDLCMPRSNGTEAILGIKRRCPKVKIIVLTVHKTTEHILAALDAGADGYVVKTDTGNELLSAIQSIENGKTFLSPSVCKQVVSALDRDADSDASPSWGILTPRERQVMKLIAEGHNNKQIAAYLSVSHKTVEKHRANLMQKLDLHNAPAVTAYAIHNGLVA